MLPSERDPDDRDRTHESGQEMSQGDPPAADHNPDDISDQGHRFHGSSLLPINHLSTEWPKREGRDQERSNTPGNPDNGNEGQDSGDDPSDCHEESPQNDPKEISDETERTVERSDLNGICIGHAVLRFQDQAGILDLPSSDEIVFHVISSGNDARFFFEGRKYVSFSFFALDSEVNKRPSLFHFHDVFSS